MQTIAELNEVLISIAQSHLQISSYGFGSVTHFEEALKDDKSLFPALWVELDTFTGESTTHTRFINIHITDINANQMQAFSDTEQIALDVLHLLRVKYKAIGLDVQMTHTMLPLAYRGVDHAHGFQISLELEYADPYDACAAPVIGGGADCLKVWNTTESTWENTNVEWNKAGLSTSIINFVLVPATYPAISPQDVDINVEIVEGNGSNVSYTIVGSNGYNSGIQSNLITTYTDTTQSTTNVTYTLTVSYLDCDGNPSTLIDSVNLIVT